MATSEEEQQQFKYDVFLSYNRRERDAGSFFPQHLHDVLTQKGIKSYKYGEDLVEGEETAPAVDEAIKDSRIALVILSRRYASSASCLSELGTILEQNNQIGKRVMPLFYGVESSWVRRQRESYQEAMAEHESRYGIGSDKVRQWREALTEVGDMRGWILAGNQSEAKFVQQVAGDIGTVLQQLKAPNTPKPEASPKHLHWAEVIANLTLLAPLICFPSIMFLASGAAFVFPPSVVITFVSVNGLMFSIAAARILRGKLETNAA